MVTLSADGGVNSSNIRMGGDIAARHYHVFVGPTRNQIDESWTEDVTSEKESSSQKLAWKIKRYDASVYNESREVMLSKCRERRAEDDLVAVRRSSRIRSASQNSHRPVESSQRLSQVEQRRSSPQTANLFLPGSAVSRTHYPLEEALQDASKAAEVHSNRTESIFDSPSEWSRDRPQVPRIYSDRTESISNASSNTRKSMAAREPLSVPPKVNLGPARRIGISSTSLRKQPPFLKTLERSKLREAEGTSRTPTRAGRSCVASSDMTRERSKITDTIMESSAAAVTTTFDSIPPPPAHTFTLSTLSDISRMLRSPEAFLPVAKGGRRNGDAPSLNILVLVRHVSAMEEVRNRYCSDQRRSTRRRCELIVQDRNQCMIKVVLEGQCARRWAEMGGEDSSYFRSNRFPTVLRERSNQSCLVRNQSFGESTPQINKQDLLLPIRPGDVVALTDLRLSRSKQKPSSVSSSAPGNGTDSSVYLTASDVHSSALELCWRSEAVESHDDLINFEPDLIAFDSRCRAIYELAMSWKVT